MQWPHLRITGGFSLVAISLDTGQMKIEWNLKSLPKFISIGSSTRFSKNCSFPFMILKNFWNLGMPRVPTLRVMKRPLSLLSPLILQKSLTKDWARWSQCASFVRSLYFVFSNSFTYAKAPINFWICMRNFKKNGWKCVVEYSASFLSSSVCIWPSPTSLAFFSMWQNQVLWTRNGKSLSKILSLVIFSPTQSIALSDFFWTKILC